MARCRFVYFTVLFIYKYVLLSTYFLQKEMVACTWRNLLISKAAKITEEYAYFGV